MAFSDFEVFTFGSPVVEISAVAPVEGTASLRLTGNSSFGLSTHAYLAPDSSGFTQGITQGRLRILAKYVTTSGFTPLLTFRLYAMMSARNITSGSHSFYTLSIRRSDGLLTIHKTTTGSIGNIGPGLVSTTVSLPVDGISFALEFSWFVSLSEFNGVSLKAKYGLADDYTDLNEVLSVIDATSPIVTSIVESFGIASLPDSVASMDTRIDKVQLYSTFFE
jgi:hypothetical protein